MRGGGSFGDRDGEAESKRLTPSIGLRKESDPPSDTANEDFLFHLYRGSELLQDNRVHEAKEELERALHLQPRDAKGQDLLAVVYFRLGLYPRAIAIYEQLRRKSPRDGALLLNLALCYLKTGQPALARRDLEKLLGFNPGHTRAWGYLGLACERLGDLEAAERAFDEGGHVQMARRIAARRPDAAPRAREPAPAPNMRDVVAAAFEELDAGQLSFELAQPASDSGSSDAEAQNWSPIELGQHQNRRTRAPSSEAESEKPDTKDGPPPARAPIPQLGLHATSRRPTLIAPAAPAPAEPIEAFPPSRSPSFALDSQGAPSLRRPVVAVPPVRPRAALGAAAAPSAPVVENLPRPPTLPPPVADLTRETAVAFPTTSTVALHSCGVALVRTKAGAGFAARMESIRAMSTGLATKLLERHANGKPTGESFGGIGSPLLSAAGEGELVLAPRVGRKLSSFELAGDVCFVREEVLLGFDTELTFENGRLTSGEGELFSVVSFKGGGAVLIESVGELLALEVRPARGLYVRREVVLGWFGRIVPRALATSESPGGQRGLVSFAGEGRVLVTSA